MKKSKLFIILALCLVLITSSVSARVDNEKISVSEDSPTSDIILEYLIDAGYPMHIIESLDDATRLEFYEGKYRYESSGTTYGIFTENYKIEYMLDNNGEVIIDNENRSELEQLLENDSEIAHILHDKEKSELCDNAVISDISIVDSSVPLSLTNGYDKMTQEEYIQKRETENRQFMAENAQLIESIKTEPPTASLNSLSNWTASIVCSHRDYRNGVAVKRLTYSWTWNYIPYWTLTDKVSMAWSGGFTSEPDTVYWTYTAFGFRMDFTTKKYDTRTWSGKGNKNGDNRGFDEYSPGAGVAKGIDIINSFGDMLELYEVYKHSGTFSTDITKTTSTNSRESAIGRYYHKQITPGGLSLSFSASGPSIGVSSGSNYDQSPDSAVPFWATTK